MIGLGLGITSRLRGGGFSPLALIVDEDDNAIEDDETPGTYWAAPAETEE
jgi:hypothetical protein